MYVLPLTFISTSKNLCLWCNSTPEQKDLETVYISALTIGDK